MKFWPKCLSPYSAGERRLMEMVNALATQQDKIMSEIDDLNAAETTLASAVTAAVADIQTLTAQLAANAGNGDAAAINEAVTKLNSLAANLNNAVNPPVPIAPASAPTTDTPPADTTTPAAA